MGDEKKPTCATCNDTHEMKLGAGWVTCLYCESAADAAETARKAAAYDGLTAERDGLAARVAALEAEARIAWEDCSDSSCRACAKCHDRLEAQATELKGEVARSGKRVAELEAERDAALATALNRALADAAVCLSCGRIGVDDWGLREDQTGERNAVCPKCGSEDVDEVEDAMRRLSKAHAGAIETSDALHEAEALRQEAERERDAATARAEALAKALQRIEAGPHGCPKNPTVEDMIVVVGGIALFARDALSATPPTDLTQHPAFRAGVEASHDQCVERARDHDGAAGCVETAGEKEKLQHARDEAIACATEIRALLEAK